MAEDIVKQLAAHISALNPAEICPPASEEQVRRAEAELGFQIPPLLRSIYLNVGNGGFGPGYGIIGVGAGGHRSDLGTLVQTREEIKRGADYLGLEWQDSLLPFCGWGCNIFSCVDGNDPGGRIIRSDECGIEQVNYNLDTFFQMWLDGKDILDGGNAESERTTVEIINPFTRGKMRVTSRHKKAK
jgi:hypothetical protein